MPALVAAQTRRAPAPPDPAVSFRPFFLATGEQFAAVKTFEAAFAGKASGPFWGGGVQLDFRRGVFVELSVSRFSRTGQRAFVSNAQVFPLGIPLTTTVTPIEVTAGARVRATPRIVPYVGGGVGRYGYSETSAFSDDLNADHIGFVVFGGTEVHVSRWIGVGIDAQLTQVSGILGDAGLSKDLGETDLGGTSVPVKILIGR